LGLIPTITSLSGSKRKQAVMKKLILLAISTVLFLSCNEGYSPSVPCTQSVEATVRDLTGLDGCGFVFELNDGTRLEPHRILLFCGTPPLPKEVTEDPLYQFEWVDGKRVKIGYDVLTDGVSICMVGPMVKITCIEELDQEQATTDK
jgi:hypothetical protein